MYSGRASSFSKPAQSPTYTQKYPPLTSTSPLTAFSWTSNNRAGPAKYKDSGKLCIFPTRLLARVMGSPFSCVCVYWG